MPDALGSPGVVDDPSLNWLIRLQKSQLKPVLASSIQWVDFPLDTSSLYQP